MVGTSLATAPPVRVPRSGILRLGGRDLLVAWPEEPPPAEGYPLLLLLDGDAVFATAVEAARAQARRPAVTGVGPAVLVGIGGSDGAGQRTRDCTPSAGKDGSGGGADAFLDLLEADILPAIAAALPCDPARRGVFGHSLAGLLVLHALFTRPGLFRRHVAASPSIWWDDRAILASAARFLAAPPPVPGPRLLLTVGALEGDDPSADPARRARQRERRMVANARDLARRLRAPGSPDVTLVEFPGENHASTLPAALSRAVRFALEARV